VLRRRSLLALLTSQIGLVACGGATPEPTTPKPGGSPEPAGGASTLPPPTPDAHERAVAATGARIRGLLHVSRVRSHPLAPELIALAEAQTKVLEGTGITPLDDVDRVFFAAKSARDPEAVMAVLEHHVEPERLKQAMQTMVDRSGEEGQWLDEEPYPAAVVVVEERRSLVAAVTPTLLVITAPQLREQTRTLMASPGLPEPQGAEAVYAFVSEPRKTLGHPKGTPPIPETLAFAEATITFQDNGDADLHVEGQSADTAQARADADEINEAIMDATSTKMGSVRVQVIQPIVFEAEGNMLKGDRHVSLAEMQTAVGLAKMAGK